APIRAESLRDTTIVRPRFLSGEVLAIISVQHHVVDPKHMKPIPIKSIAHYRIVEPIGAGGMGAVYKAYDNKLQRIVALKLLPAEYVSQEDRRRRFFQEARAASALNHPHILTIYEVGEDEGKPYIAMEYVEGETLRQKIK